MFTKQIIFTLLLAVHLQARGTIDYGEEITALREELLDLKSARAQLYRDLNNINIMKGGIDGPKAKMVNLEAAEYASMNKQRVEELEQR